MSGHDNFFYNLEKSALVSVIGVILLFSASICVVLIAPSYIDETWTQPSSNYQVQMYEVADPNVYIGTSLSGGQELQFVNHIKEDYTLLAFHESTTLRIVAPPELEKYVTRLDDPILKLSSKLLLLRLPQEPATPGGFNAKQAAEKIKQESSQKDGTRIDYEILELYSPGLKEAFSEASPDTVLSDWVDRDFKIIDENVKQLYHKDPGVVYINNPREYRLSKYKFGDQEGWHYDPNGTALKDIQQLTSHPLGFRSRKELIQTGEHIYSIEGCWYCHTDQTRTLIQDVVLNGSDSYPAPPSSANEYIYQYVTFPGTKRNGPDISRVGVKRPSRDWHKGHFWSPKTASAGSIMPSFQHFFDHDPRGTSKNTVGIPNYQFEAVFQYLMTKGTRITPPTEAWWLGKDPVKTKEIIEGKRKLP